MAHTVLIADDDPDILSIVSLCLEAEGYLVHSAVNGREAVEMATAHHPDLILMDMMMPELSGCEAASVLRADARTRDIPIVGLSAKAMTADLEQAVAAGIDGYITKPFRVARVLAVVRSHLKV
jgi:two-component system cell cycle response regulator DivK